MKDIKGYEGLYAVTEDGKVWSYAGRGRFLKPGDDSHGYLLVKLFKDNEYKSFRVHRLVAEAFLPNPDNLEQVHHKNGIRTDNSIENLQWVSQNRNLAYMYAEQLNKWGVYVDWSQVEEVV
jgi:hypothetical protein